MSACLWYPLESEEASSMFYLMTDPEDQTNLLPVGKNPVLGEVPLIFITNLR